MPKLLVAMSGGVDSAAAALLALRGGWECVGCTMRLTDPPPGAPDDAAAAAAVCAWLGIAHRVLDLRREFASCVIAPFAREYERGRTPNPCVVCNQTIKFGALADYARAQGFDALATGHYARVFRRPDGRYVLRTAEDRARDQTYVLYRLTQQQLAFARFPLGGLTKPAVRELAASAGFENAHRRDSQDICFVPDGDYGAFLERRGGKVYPPGDFISPDGRVLGRHRGAVRYTIGQRRGLGLALPAPGYVLAKDMDANTVTVGPPERLMARRVWLSGCNWIDTDAPAGERRVTAKLRYSQQAASCLLRWDGRTAELCFDAPQRAPAAGQSAVCYDGEIVAGGGTIERAEFETPKES